MKVLIEIDDLNKLRVAALDNDNHIEKLCAINAELTAQVAEKDRCIARLKDKLALHESSLQFIDGLVKDQAERIRRMMAGESLEAAKPDSDGWISWAGGDRPVADDTIVDIRFRDGEVYCSSKPGNYPNIASNYRWPLRGNGWDIIAYRIVEPVAKPDSDGWIEWSGGESPVNGDVEVKFKNGDTYSTKALWLNYWDRDIVAYRIVEPVPDSDGWISWTGGDRPVADDVKVEVQYCNGTTEIEIGGKLSWWHGPTDWDIVAYRIVK